MEDLKRRILNIVSNCNKPKVKAIHCSVISMSVYVTDHNNLFFLYASVPYPAAGIVVWGVWRRPKWLSHWDGQQEGGGAQPAAAGGGVTHHPPLIVLSEPGLGRLAHPHSCTLTSLPARTGSSYHRRRAVTQVCLHFTQFTVNMRHWIQQNTFVSVSGGVVKIKYYYGIFDIFFPILFMACKYLFLLWVNLTVLF